MSADQSWIHESLSSMNLTYGSTIRLRHDDTRRLLKSYDKRFPSPSKSLGQVVVATNDEADETTCWRIKGRHGSADDFRRGEAVRNGDILRLEHVTTRANLHSHPRADGHLAPVTRNGDHQEVIAYGRQGFGDDNDDWELDTEGNPFWELGARVKLFHRKTRWPLHSHDASDPFITAGFQEVTAFASRDHRDYWVAEEPPANPIGGFPSAPSAKGEKAEEPKTLTEKIQNHVLWVVFSALATGAVAGWTACYAILVQRSEKELYESDREVARVRARLTDEEQDHARTTERLKTTEAELALRNNLFKEAFDRNKPVQERFTALSNENASLRSDVTQLKEQIDQINAREWHGLSDDQIEAWAKRLAGRGIKRILVLWGPNVQTRLLYHSLQRLADAIPTTLATGIGGSPARTITVTASPDEAAAPVLVQLFNDTNYPCVLEIDKSTPAGEVMVTIGERIP